jgi:hypothetical protein
VHETTHVGAESPRISDQQHGETTDKKLQETPAPSISSDPIRNLT